MQLAKHCAGIGKDETVDLTLMSTIETLFRSLACLNGSFLQTNEAHMCCTVKNHGLNIADAETAFSYIRKMENSSLKNIVRIVILQKINEIDSIYFIYFEFQQIWEGVITQIIESLTSSPADVEVLRIYLLLPIYHEFINSKNYEMLHTPFSRAVLNLTKIPLNILTQWWAEQSVDYFERMVENYKSVVMHILTYKFGKTESSTETPIVTFEPNLEVALKMLKLLYQINTNHRTNRLSYELFYLPDLSDMIDLQRDFYNWSQNQEQVSISNEIHKIALV